MEIPFQWNQDNLQVTNNFKKGMAFYTSEINNLVNLKLHYTLHTT